MNTALALMLAKHIVTFAIMERPDHIAPTTGYMAFSYSYFQEYGYEMNAEITENEISEIDRLARAVGFELVRMDNDGDKSLVYERPRLAQRYFKYVYLKSAVKIA